MTSVFVRPRLVCAVLALLAAGEAVGSYEFGGYWLDIGREDDYRTALADGERLLDDLLPEEAR